MSSSTGELKKKVHELILNKLFLKVKGLNTFEDKTSLISVIFFDILALAEAGFDIGLAASLLGSSLQKELTEERLLFVGKEYEEEIETYIFYLKNKEILRPEEIHEKALSFLNSDYELLETKIHEVIARSLQRKLSRRHRLVSDELVENFVQHVKVLSIADSLESAVKLLHGELTEHIEEPWLTQKHVTTELEYINQFAEDEITAYKQALLMWKDKQEFVEILSVVRLMLKL